MRVTGAIILVIAGVMWGLTAAGELKKTVRRRETLCRLLEHISWELERFHTPIPELFSALAVTEPGEAGRLCREVAGRLSQLGRISFGEIWTGCISFLSPEERAMLSGLGNVLGRYGTEEQISALESCRREMESAHEKAKKCAQELGRVYIGVSTCAGVMAAVLLM